MRPVGGIIALLVLAGCAPKFKPEGTLTLGGAPFVPVRCGVLGRSLGIELTTAEGWALNLVLPWARLNAFEEVKGEPHFVSRPVAGPVVEADGCGSLLMRGEGYHGDGKRAASGKLSLACDVAQGELTFRGCF